MNRGRFGLYDVSDDEDEESIFRSLRGMSTQQLVSVTNNPNTSLWDALWEPIAYWETPTPPKTRTAFHSLFFFFFFFSFFHSFLSLPS